jgi:hypothetical protein
MRILALVLLLAAAAWRILAPHVPELNNFSPLMALAFCGGMYFRNRWMWLVPFGALLLSDLYLDHYYWVEFHYRWTTSGAALRQLCFASGLLIGYQLSGRRSWATLFGGALGASLLFFLVTNTASWFGDGYYAHTAAGWWQAMTVGHPQFPSTLYFYRNTLASDLLFTGVFGLAMEYAAWREGKPSLLGKHA